MKWTENISTRFGDAWRSCLGGIDFQRTLWDFETELIENSLYLFVGQRSQQPLFLAFWFMASRLCANERVNGVAGRLTWWGCRWPWSSGRCPRGWPESKTIRRGREQSWRSGKIWRGQRWPLGWGRGWAPVDVGATSNVASRRFPLSY